MTGSVFTVSLIAVDEVTSGGSISPAPRPPSCARRLRRGRDPFADSAPNALWNVSALVFDGKLAFEAVVDRFDPLANAAELAQPRLLVYGIAADEGGIAEATAHRTGGLLGALQQTSAADRVLTDRLLTIESGAIS